MATPMLNPLMPSFGGTHVVLLGAGASRAVCNSGDKYGRKLPLMSDLVDIVGLRSILKKYSIIGKTADFEALYSFLSTSSEHDELLYEVDEMVFKHFAQLKLPENPTLYDHMLLCLRKKDRVATFNWDPLLPQALHRIAKRFGPDILPEVWYLHGNVVIGYCRNHEIPTVAFRGYPCGRCGAELSRSKLLFPVAEKGYHNDPFISRSWSALKESLGRALILTVFGYSTPQTDVEASTLIKEGWGDANSRQLEQIEIIDIRPSKDLYESWSTLICREHYGIMKDFYQSYAAQHPRRSCEDFFEAAIQNNPQEERPIPRNASWEELEEWVSPLLEQERVYENSTKSDEV